ncbi:PREDICTED: zinc finger protein 836-like [Eufriesea mexicana]|uniref:zinc finger protein 836-like n=1 Tax=Eufriesea mexicana TaxID=516756 RepID=UPI00083C5B34|nr:PREDICTED: zinc finger protein 836-like [Eufriesea mexicana]
MFWLTGLKIHENVKVIAGGSTETFQNRGFTTLAGRKHSSLISILADIDTLSTPRDPLEQTYLVVQNVDKYFLLPVQHNVPTQKQQEQVPTAPEVNVKTEVQEDVAQETREQPPAEGLKLDDRSRLPPALPIQLPLQLSQWLDQYSSSEDTMTKTMGTEKIFTCDYCPKAFRQKYSLQRHQATHSNTRTFECSVCQQLLKTKRTLRFHMMLHEDSGKIFQCTDCGFMSKRNHSLKRHQIRIHSKYFNYKCPHCPKMFKLNADLKRHQMKHVIAPCYCEVCGKMYQNEFFLRVHQTMGKNRRTTCCYTAVQNGRIIVKATSARNKKGDVKRVFKCSQCKWRFSSWKLLRKHMQRHFLSYNCETCGAVFKYKASFLKHQDSHKEEQLESTLPLRLKNEIIVGDQTKEQLIALHKSSSILQRRIAFQVLKNCKRGGNWRLKPCNPSGCIETKNISTNCTNFERRKVNNEERNSSRNPASKKLQLNSNNCSDNLHNNEKDSTQQEDLYKKLHDGTYTCDICQTTFEQKSKILRHIISKHSFHRPFKCLTCDKTFKYKCDLKAHRLVHQDVDTSLLHCCDKCDYRTKTKNNLKSHYIRRHTDDYKFACEHCGKRFKMEWDLKFHIGTHSSSQHMCDICGKFYTSNYSLYKHRKVAHLNEYKFQCKVCNKRLLTQENLDNHMQQHSRTYECKECGKVFASKRYLVTHMTTHTGVKPYTCHICMKNFRTSHMRNTHLLTHSAERPHICDLCGQSFKRRYYMIEHRRKHPDAHLSSPPVPLGKKKGIADLEAETVTDFQAVIPFYHND